METKILTGKIMQGKIFQTIKEDTDQLRKNHGIIPGIAFIGFDGFPLNKYSFPLHVKCALDAGFKVEHQLLSMKVTDEEVKAVIDEFNADESIDAIVVLQPVPPQLNPLLIESMILPQKEVECFHPQNMLQAVTTGTFNNNCRMCLPQALEEILKEENIPVGLEDRWVFVLDKEFFSNQLTLAIVNTAAKQVVPPGAPVTFVSSSSSHLREIAITADFLAIISKKICFFQREWLKDGVVIIDVYSNLVKEVPSKGNPSDLVPVIRGGIDIEKARNKAAAILPVPGGLMTLVLGLLLQNTLKVVSSSRKPSPRSLSFQESA
ncbi:MAG: tetrahydrofolate dehydrogenase/cyclohydrolase catalytic domain-containing protein [Syntrophothermus sp.]